MSAKVIYKDIALGAAENAAVSASGAEDFSVPDKITAGISAPAIATCELGGWGLSHDYKARGEQSLAFWSKAKSGADCLFAAAPSITLSFTEQYTSTGLTVRFAPGSMDFCRQCRVEWYRGAALRQSGDYAAAEPVLIINKTVEGFDRVVFTFQQTNLPKRRCKIEGITIGVVREFGADELKSVSAINEVDLISENLPINVLDVALHSKDNIEYIFQRKQPIEAYDGDNLIGVYYIEKGKRTGSADFSVSCKDAVGLLDLAAQPGGIWLSETPLSEVLSAVFGGIVSFEVDSAYQNSTLQGFIEPGTMREALRQITFVLGAVADTSGTDKVRIFPAPYAAAAISPKKTYSGGTIETADKVTEVTVTAYRFFDERPESDDEYVELGGVQYRYYTETKHAYNTDVVSGDPENKVKFIGQYLCNLGNAQGIANRIMEHCKRREKYSFSHVLSGEAPAGKYAAALPWGNTRSGNITKMSITLSGITVSAAEMLLDEQEA